MTNLINLNLRDFRSHESLVMDLTEPITVMVGENASGKTNVLEAIFLLATGESFRAERIDDMVRWGVELGHVVGEVGRDQGEGRDRLRVTVTRGMVQGKRTAKRRFFVNEVGKRKSDFVGKMAVVLFEPEVSRIISGSPGRRRDFMNTVLKQADREYARSWDAYERALKRRNKILDLIAEGKSKPSALTFWDELIVNEGEVLRQKREGLVKFINSRPMLKTERIVKYMPSVLTSEKLRQNLARDIAVGHTLSGPHKDDFVVHALESGKKGEERNLSRYGSRGEQRMAVLWLKMGELSFLEAAFGERPILLLDDVFSELDQEHEEVVWEMVRGQQSIITTAEEVGENYLNQSKLKVMHMNKEV